MQAHAKGQVRSTKFRRPLILVYYEVYFDKDSDIKREKYLKTTYGHRYLKNRFPNDDKLGLVLKWYYTGQEGLTRTTNPDKLHFLNIANGSLSEIDTQIEISFRLNYISNSVKENFEKRLITVQKLLSGLIRSMKNSHWPFTVYNLL